MGWIEKNLRKIFDVPRKHFESGGRLEKLGPLFEAIEDVFFFPAEATKNRPLVRDSLDLKRFMSSVLVALIPPLLFGIYNTGYHSRLASEMSTAFIPSFTTGLGTVLPIILVSYAVGLFWELLFAAIRKHPISEGFLVTGLLFPLTLPPTIPLWQVAVGITFGVVIGKEVFGGTGRNLFNPALTARAFVFFAYPAQLSGNAVWVAAKQKAAGAVDAVTGPTPLAVTELQAPFNSIQEILTDQGYTFATLFWGQYPGTIGGTSALCSLLGAGLLILLGIASYRTILGAVAGLLATGFLLNLAASPDTLPWFSVNPFYHLVAGGFAFGAAYMATDPVTAPGTDRAKWIYGFLIGALTVLIRVVNPAFPEGVMLAILFMNMFAPLLEYTEIRLRVKKRIPHV
ncbi:Na+-transporting NADH:ubiquinone oxidoreductase subunit B [Desulfosalsimonas propionicica]|uniref:Na(+)-translocating NADH-quinone reductase subunit B n=1 Tax=Desulfosalsimonas propionicica TaxID=332175 RepID=A0A7W0C5T3_9BACT|nr:NADH:ubiquinone reductase (Na(+)-transporting) subunit B [Desulfosalsimonas propionicica]MBA2879714.1 Na+-transporting NADH:ubiquinone oxidoreductase subunit B [Desulfosalsimonas propionicica]